MITEGYEVLATTVKSQNAFTPTVCFCTFQLVGGQNTHDQITSVIEVSNAHDLIALCAFYSLLMEMQTKLAT